MPDHVSSRSWFKTVFFLNYSDYDEVEKTVVRKTVIQGQIMDDILDSGCNSSVQIKKIDTMGRAISYTSELDVEGKVTN